MLFLWVKTIGGTFWFWPRKPIYCSRSLPQHSHYTETPLNLRFSAVYFYALWFCYTAFSGLSYLISCYVCSGFAIHIMLSFSSSIFYVHVILFAFSIGDVVRPKSSQVLYNAYLSVYFRSICSEDFSADVTQKKWKM